ncbi:solute carrier 12 [Chamberlinius hualienensis]
MKGRSGGVADSGNGDVSVTRFSVNHVHENAGFHLGESDNAGHYYQSENVQNSDNNYILSLMQTTKEAFPRIDLYRNTRSVSHAMRPTLDELHNGTVAQNTADDQRKDVESGEHSGGHEGHVKFGWIEGVLVLNLMSLWGPMLFLRTSWLVGQGGLIQACIIIMFSTIITGITALSTSAIATNGEVKGGGTYYMLSRSLGPEFGGAIGLIFAFANMVGVATNIVGFCEALTDLLAEFGLKIVDGGVNDTRIIGVCAVVFCLIICLVGMEWEQKAQFVFLFILLSAIFDVIAGSLMPNNPVRQSKGFTGWSLETAKANAMSDYRGETFLSIFSVYFPSVTGILSGANISGELKDPQAAIPKGTLLAIMITSSSYLFFAILSGFTIVRDASGLVANGTVVPCVEASGNCTYGLENYYQMLMTISAFKWLIYAGNFSATLSSALACLVGAPRVFQALCRDRIYPYIFWFGKGYGKSDDPLRCYGLTFIIAVGFILIGELNTIATLMSTFFMAAFCLINFAVFYASFTRSPGFRPSFRYWNKWVGLFGFALCLAVAFAMDYQTSIATLVISVFLVSYIYYNKPDVNWGSSSQARHYKNALQSTQQLTMTEEHVKNYRPQILVYSGSPISRPPLVDFSYYITKSIGLTICGHVIKTPIYQKELNALTKRQYEWLQERRCKAFYSTIEETSFERGAKALVQTVGVGKLRPNMILLGYKSNWQTCGEQDVVEYASVVHDAFDRHMAVGILRMQKGLDYSFFTEETGLRHSQASMDSLGSGIDGSANKLRTTDSLGSLVSADSGNSLDAVDTTNTKDKKKKKDMLPDNIPQEICDNINWFHHKQKKGMIDVWWLYDDGGLTLLIPYILSTRKDWMNCKLRIFSLAHSSSPIGDDQRNMAALLSKFRIDCADVVILSDVTKPAKQNTENEFNEILNKFKEENCNQESPLIVNDSELILHKERSNRYMRIREYLKEYSTEATLVVMTLPMPRKHRVPTALYMTWLEILTKDMPPFLLIRGNQTSVLTFYS